TLDRFPLRAGADVPGGPVGVAARHSRVARLVDATARVADQRVAVGVVRHVDIRTVDRRAQSRGPQVLERRRGAPGRGQLDLAATTERRTGGAGSSRQTDAFIDTVLESAEAELVAVDPVVRDV